MEKKNLDPVSISADLGLVNLTIANVPVTSTDMMALKSLTAGDQITFVMKNDGFKCRNLFELNSFFVNL